LRSVFIVSSHRSELMLTAYSGRYKKSKSRAERSRLLATRSYALVAGEVEDNQPILATLLARPCPVPAYVGRGYYEDRARPQSDRARLLIIDEIGNVPTDRAGAITPV